MQIIRKASVFFIFTIALATFQLWTSEASAQSSYFTSRGCAGCHAVPVVASCNGCHYHGNRSLNAATNKTSYAPGEAVTVTLTSTSTRAGWIKATLFNQNNVQLAESTGNASGMGSSTIFPAALSAPAPTTPGTYIWKMAYYGNSANTGSTHGAVTVNTNSFTVASAVDTTKPVVSIFTLPANATSLTVPVSSLTATDNVAVTGYLINKSATAPTTGWIATAPASVTAVAGSNTFYAWARDAAGNISVSASATVTVTTVPPTKIGVYDPAVSQWFIDYNGNGVWNGTPTDRSYSHGFTGTIPVTGDWNGTGITQISSYSPATVQWYLDYSSNGIWDGTPTDRIFWYGLAGAIPVTGDWNGNGTTKIGAYDKGTWYLDLNGNGVWDGASTDGLYTFGEGLTGAHPVTGDWTGDGTTKIGVYVNGIWYLDLNGNKTWNGPSIDRQYNFGFNEALAVTGDWNGDGKTEIGTYKDGIWYLDLNGNGAWNGTPTDANYIFGAGVTGAVPVAGKW